MPALRYVVLHHAGIPQPHYDLMFETAAGGELATWRSPHWPPKDGDTLTRIAEHRAAFLEYEGPVSSVGGHVVRVARGTFKFVKTKGGGTAVVLDNGRRILLP